MRCLVIGALILIASTAFALEPLIFPPPDRQDTRTEAYPVGIVGPANTPQAARAYIEADDWFTLPPLNYIIPPYAEDALGDLRICLDPGHGAQVEMEGYKRGATGFREAVMNFEVATMLAEFLEESGAEVVMTRGGDYNPEGGSLEWRARLADRENCDLFLSIHHNAHSRQTANYLTVWYHARPDYPRANVDLARWIVTELGPINRLDEPQHMGIYSDWLIYPPDAAPETIDVDANEMVESGFGVLRYAQVPACLVEGSFFTHPREELRLMDREYLRREAWGIYQGILNYMWAGIPKFTLHEEQSDVVRGPRPTVRFTLDDGMHEGWARNSPPRLHYDTLRVFIDDERATLSYIPAFAEVRATPRQDLEPGEHVARLRVLNAWGNWSWPTEIPFTVE